MRRTVVPLNLTEEQQEAIAELERVVRWEAVTGVWNGPAEVPTARRVVASGRTGGTGPGNAVTGRLMAGV